MRDTVSQRIGATLRATRIARGVTQADLARQLGVDRVTISRYEAGSRPMTVATLLHLAAFLEVSPSDLLTGIPAQVQPDTDGEDAIRSADMRWIIRTLVGHPALVSTVKAFLYTYVTADPGEQPVKRRG